MDDSKITIAGIKPLVGISGGDVTMYCSGLNPFDLEEDSLHFCGSEPLIEAASTNKIVAHIPEKLSNDDVYIIQDGIKSNIFKFHISPLIASILHNVDNPAITKDGKIFATFSGSKGQITPASIFAIDKSSHKVPFISGIINATSLLIGRDGFLYISSRYDGKVYKSELSGEYKLFSQGLGEAFGMAMDSSGNLFVGDRTGSIFKIDKTGRADIFASLPASNIAYHLSIDSNDELFVTVPMQIGENVIYNISPEGKISEFHSDMMEFHGVAVDANDNIFVAVTNRDKGAIHMINRKTKENRKIVSGEEIVGLAFDAEGNIYFSTFSRIYFLDKKFISFD